MGATPNRPLRVGWLVEPAFAPVDADVARLTGSTVFLYASMRDGAADTILGILPLQPDTKAVEGRAVAMLRPEQLMIRREGAGTPGTVVKVNFHGNHNRVVVKVGELLLPVRVTDETYAAGDTALVSAQGRCVVYPK